MGRAFRLFQHLLPRTKTWSLPFRSTIRRFFEGLADGLVEPAIQFVDGVWEQMFPDTTDELVEWEQELGCWGCGTEEQRRMSLAAEWQATGGQSPRYIQDIIQAAGFDVYVHSWWDPIGEVVRDPHDYSDDAHSGTEQCHGTVDSIQDQCADVDTDDPPRCDFFFANPDDAVYIVNESLNRRAPPPLPTDSDLYRNFIYFCDETFGDPASVPVERLIELKRLMLKLSPANLWILPILSIAPTITITPPASTEYVVGVSAQLTGGSARLVGEQVQASFTATFDDIVGTSGVIGVDGLWSLDVTAAAGDVGKTTLYVREVGGTTARATLACTVVTIAHKIVALFPSLSHAATLVYDPRVGVTQVGGVASAWADSKSGLAADTCSAGGGEEAIFTAEDAWWTGPSLSATGASYLHAAAGTTTFAQPFTVIEVQAGSGYNFVMDGGGGSNRVQIFDNANQMYVGAGGSNRNIAYTTGRTTTCAIVRIDDAGTEDAFFRCDGVETVFSSTGTPGTNSFRGMSIFAKYDGTGKATANIGLRVIMAGAATNDECAAFVDQIYKGILCKHRPLLIAEGDSITAGSGLSDPSNEAYPWQLVDSLGHGYSMNSVATAGDKVADIAAAYATTVAPLYTTYRDNCVLLVWIGSNDIAASATAANTLTALWSYCDTAKAAGFKVIVGTMIKRADVLADSRETQRLAYNAGILANYAAHSAGVCDLAALAAFSDPSDSTYYQADGIHPKLAGAAAAAAAWETSVLAAV